MTDINQPNGELRQHLMRQQRTEWNHLLGSEMALRLALYARQERERLDEQQGAINVSQRAELSRKHESQRDALRQQDRKNRLATLKRHTQEMAALKQSQN